MELELIEALEKIRTIEHMLNDKLKATDSGVVAEIKIELKCTGTGVTEQNDYENNSK